MPENFSQNNSGKKNLDSFSQIQTSPLLLTPTKSSKDLKKIQENAFEHDSENVSMTGSWKINVLKTQIVGEIGEIKNEKGQYNKNNRIVNRMSPDKESKKIYNLNIITDFNGELRKNNSNMRNSPKILSPKSSNSLMNKSIKRK